MIFAVKIPVEVSEDDGRIVEGQSRIVNWAYNHLLEKANQWKEEFKKTGNPELSKIIYTKTGLRDLLPELKKEYPFLKAVHSVPLKNAALSKSS